MTAAVIERIVNLKEEGLLPSLRSVTLELWEADEAFAPALRKNLSHGVGSLRKAGLETKVALHQSCYINGAVKALDTGLFGNQSPSTITHAILNTPYRKILANSEERGLMGAIGIETSNLYSAFVWLALRQLVVGGELSAITPRSFCNGPYFRDFRRDLLELSAFRRVHLFDSRSKAFGRDQVLQENILFHLVREKGKRAALEISTGRLEAPAPSEVIYDRFVSPDDRDQVIHLATEADADEVRTFVQSLPCKLVDLNLEVSTGPVVDFRLRGSLSQDIQDGEVPLLYPHCVKAGQVIPPHARSSSYEDARQSKKAVAIQVNEETQRRLLPVARFVLIKRFSSKEEKRRLVAGVLDPDCFQEGSLGIENHLNYFHRSRKGLGKSLAAGLSRFLNSTAADRYFRQFNGHTQVNVSDLRAFRFPAVESLETLGSIDLDDSDQACIDQAMTSLLGAPVFQTV